METLGRLRVRICRRRKGVIDDQFAFFFLRPCRRKRQSQPTRRCLLILLWKILRSHSLTGELRLKIRAAERFCIGKNDVDEIERGGAGILQSVDIMNAKFRRGSGDELNFKGLFQDLVAGSERHGT